MKVLLLALAFILELIAFFSFAFSSRFLFIDKTFQIILGIILFVALIGFWSLFMAPKASRKFKPVPYYIAKSIIYLLAAIVLFSLNSGFGICFFILALLDEVLLYKHNLS